jgi:AraC-like DNA-binding protein
MSTATAVRPATRPHWRPADIFPQANPGVHCFLHRNIEIGLHVHDFLEVNVVAHGRGRHHVNGEWQEVTTGQVFLFPPGAAHAYENRCDLHVYNVLFQGPFLASHLPALAAAPGCVPLFGPSAPAARQLSLDTRTYDDLEPLLDRADGESKAVVRGAPPASAEWLGLYIASVLGRAYDGHEAAAVRTSPAFTAVVDYVTRHPGEPMNPKSLADRAGISTTTLAALFRDTVGMSPMQFVAQTRVRAARERLADPSRTITEIALELGFYDSAHFTRTFRALTGTAPREYRRQLRTVSTC